jgi:hypothetical protein
MEMGTAFLQLLTTMADDGVWQREKVSDPHLDR